MVAGHGVRLAAFLAQPDPEPAILGDELWPNLGDGDLRKAAYRGG